MSRFRAARDMYIDRNAKHGLSRHVVAWLLVLVCAGAQITVSVPRFHSHPTGLDLAAGGRGATASEARPAQKHDRNDPAAHECLACRVLTLVSTLTRTTTVAAPGQQTVAAIPCALVQWSPVLTSSIRGRAPPLA